jgi:molybdopterin-guanine dinucleotide biosynthesis protein A
VLVEVVHDPVEGGGPLIGLRTGLAAATGDRVVVVGGDMPRLEPAVLRAMLERLALDSATGRADAVLLGAAGGGRPLPMAIRTVEARDAVEAAISAGDTALHAALARLTVAELPEDEWRHFDPTGRTLLDVDTPADLEAARWPIGR